MKKKQFVASARHFESLKEAEDRVNGWFYSGDLKTNTKIYKVTEIYDLRVKLIKRNAK